MAMLNNQRVMGLMGKPKNKPSAMTYQKWVASRLIKIRGLWNWGCHMIGDGMDVVGWG
jgi:hypothetical protein